MLESIEIISSSSPVAQRAIRTSAAALFFLLATRASLLGYLGLALLDLLQAAGLHEGPPRRVVVRQHFGELLHDVPRAAGMQGREGT